MTTPNYLKIGTREWNVLLAHNASELATFFQQQPVPSAEAFQNIIAHMDRMKQILPGWLASAPPEAQEPTSQQVQPKEPVAPQANGKGKKRGGWPKGKKRTRAAAQAMHA